MGLLQRLEVRQGQSLVMTPQLLQAIKLLQLSHLDLAAFVEAELERNPLLERPEPEPAEGRTAGDADDHDAADAQDADGAEPWLAHDLTPARADLESRLDTGLDNVFPDESPVRAPASDGDLAPLTPSPWGAGGSRDFDDGGPDFEATLSQEVGLREHLLRQLELATRDVIRCVRSAGWYESVSSRPTTSPGSTSRSSSAMRRGASTNARVVSPSGRVSVTCRSQYWQANSHPP